MTKQDASKQTLHLVGIGRVFCILILNILRSRSIFHCPETGPVVN